MCVCKEQSRVIISILGRGMIGVKSLLPNQSNPHQACYGHRLNDLRHQNGHT